MDASDVEILLIEDDPDDAELAIHILNKHIAASHLLHIDDGEKALEYLFGPQKMPKLILLDLKMPRVDGIQILRSLKEDAARVMIPVIALISSKEGKNYVESFQLKADGYIVKPIDYKKFEAMLSEIGLSQLIVKTSV